MDVRSLQLLCRILITQFSLQVDEEEDVFATATVRSSATKKQPKAAKKPDSALEDNIFADLPPAKTREKKGKKKPASEAKSIFDDDVGLYRYVLYCSMIAVTLVEVKI